VVGDGHDQQPDRAGIAIGGAEGGPNPEQGQDHGRVGVLRVVMVMVMVRVVMFRGVTRPGRRRSPKVIDGVGEGAQHGCRSDHQVDREQNRRVHDPEG
jgi:hypothetical protein